MKSYGERVWELMVQERIACPEADYPSGEALYLSIEDWENEAEVSWDDWVERFT